MKMPTLRSIFVYSQVDGGLPRGGFAPNHRTGGGTEEWCLPWQTFQLFRPQNGVCEKDLRQRSGPL